MLQSIFGSSMPWLFVDSLAWTAVGLVGNLAFSLRFLHQWIHSERLGRLAVPRLFWHLSFYGSLVNVVYSIHIDKLPVILGYLFLPVIYGRNLVLLSRAQGANANANSNANASAGAIAG